MNPVGEVLQEGKYAGSPASAVRSEDLFWVLRIGSAGDKALACAELKRRGRYGHNGPLRSKRGGAHQFSKERERLAQAREGGN
jgi:hypothetical protein